VGKDLKNIKMCGQRRRRRWRWPAWNLLLDWALVREHVWLTDLAGVVYAGRQELMDPEKARFAQAPKPVH